MNLHIVNGDSFAQTLINTSLAGDISVYREILHEGPLTGGLDAEKFRELRAGFLSGKGWPSYSVALADLTRFDKSMDEYKGYEQVILWFEHDLYDQLMLIRILDYYHTFHPQINNLYLICIDHYPGIKKFEGLGQLSPQQAMTLYPDRLKITRDQMILASKAWQACQAVTPLLLTDFIKTDHPLLPFLQKSLVRFLQEYPSVKNGLSLTQQRVLEIVQERPISARELFWASKEKEENPYLGDTTFAYYLLTMIAGKYPLLTTDQPENIKLIMDTKEWHKKYWNMSLTITSTGSKVMQGVEDWIQLEGIDRWLGGVHLSGNKVLWRWDNKANKIIGL